MSWEAVIINQVHSYHIDQSKMVNVIPFVYNKFSNIFNTKL